MKLRAKVTILILGLVTIVIVALGYLTIRDKNDTLIANVDANARREMESLSFLSSRAILDQNDLAIIDNLQNARTLPGFVYGTVTSKVTGSPVSQLVQAKEKYRTELIKLAQKKRASKKPKSNKIVAYKEDFQFDSNVELYFFQKNIYHPFIPKNPPLLGAVQFAFSDQFIQEAVAKNRNELLIIAVVFLILGITGAFALSTLIVKPIKVLSNSAEIVGSGDLTHQVPDLGSDELGALARQFNEMTQGLRLAGDKEKETAILNDQIKQAQEIQQGMNPSRFLKRDRYQIKGFTRAAKGVGGDYFDFHILEDKRLALLLSDVSGKGVSASLVMVLIKTVVLTAMRYFDAIRGDQIATAINQVICSQAHIDKFATFQFTVFDPETGMLEFSNGGHGPLFLYRARQKTCTLTELSGLPLGIDEDNEYKLTRLKLHPGDMVVMFSDGINEAWNEKKEEFGMIALRQMIIDLAEKNSKEIVTEIIEAIDEFTGEAEQHDDMTLVILKIL